MKRAIGVLVVIVGAGLGYRYFQAHGPEAHYKAFAEEILHRRYEAAAAMTAGLTARDLVKLGSQERIGAGPAMFQTLFPSKFDITSAETQADDTVRIVAMQTVLFNPAGVESAIRPAMYAKLKQVAVLRKDSGGWKIVSFENAFDSMDSVSGR